MDKTKIRDFIYKENDAPMLKHYAESLLDCLEEVEKGGFTINEDNLLQYLRAPLGGIGSTTEKARQDLERKRKLRETLKGSIMSPVKKMADWTKWGVIVQVVDLILVGCIIGILSFTLPHRWDVESSKEPIKVQIIQQPNPQNQSEPITPESSTVVVPMEIL